MDSDTLHTASTYLNNLLLARGLLKNGKTLDFAKPTRETRAQIINVVHDLLLRRDREQEHREQVAQTLRTLRSDQTRKDAEIERLQTRLAEKDRLLAQAQVDTRNAKADMKKHEISARSLQDQVVKLKATVAQVKTQVITDLKKRDLQIERLKSHLQGQQRGNKIVAPSITISGGSSRNAASFKASVRDIQDPEYSLTQETNDFLTQLSQSLSDENDSLIAMMRGTLSSLKQLLGIPEQHQAGSARAEDGCDPQISCEVLADELQTTLDTLSSLLTNPNFVSVEEVDIRDEEITRLREGWEKMEARWKETLMMMDGWRKRLEKTGDTINLDDLKRGLGLGVGFEQMPERLSPVRDRRASRRLTLQQAEDLSDEEEHSNRDSGVSGMAEQETGVVEQRLQLPKKMSTINPPDFFDLRPAKGQKLRQLSNNFQSPRRVAFAEDKMEHSEVRHEDQDEDTNMQMPTPPVIRSSNEEESIFGGFDGASSPKPNSKNRKRHSSPHSLPAAPSPKHNSQEVEELQSSSFLEADAPTLSMAEKLREAQLEAEAAKANPSPARRQDDEEELDLEFDDDVGSLRSPVKKTKIKGRPRRRKSTLSPEELESLLGLE
ncbi:hypothetical protein MBLNU457_2119t1 [Dothideomycetes sp. NU457]